VTILLIVSENNLFDFIEFWLPKGAPAPSLAPPCVPVVSAVILL
jgi:hypothetical protein